MLRRLIIAPHADDESLGCGGLIAKEPESIHVAVLADKKDGRMNEFEIARKELGYTDWTGPMRRTGELQNDMRGLVGYLDRLIAKVRPDELYLPTPGAHQDHIAAYGAGISAARLSYTDGEKVFPDVLLYNVPGYALELYQTPYHWNRFVAFGADVMEQKERAIMAYGSQMGGTMSAFGLARPHAHAVGKRVGAAFAEEFAVVRQVEKA